MTAARDTERQARYEKEWNEVEAMFYGGAEDDPIASKVESVVLEMENRCRPIIDSVVKWRAIADFAEDFGAGGRTRTDDLLITNQLLYQLSYAGRA